MSNEIEETECRDLLGKLESLGNVAIWQGSWAMHVEGKGGKPIVSIYEMCDDCEDCGDKIATGSTLIEAIRSLN